MRPYELSSDTALYFRACLVEHLLHGPGNILRAHTEDRKEERD